MTGILAMSLTAFGWDRQEKAIEKLTEAESMRAVLKMDMELNAFGIPLAAEACMDMKTIESPLKLSAQSKVDLGILGEVDFQHYVCKKDGKYLLYTKNKKDWAVREIDASDLGAYNGKFLMQTWMEQIEDLEEEEKVTLQGRTMYRYKGVVKKEGLKKMLLDTGCIRTLSESLSGSTLKSLGNIFDQKEKIEKMMDQAEELPVTLWIDEKTGYAVQCVMDVTNMLSDAFGQLVSSKGRVAAGVWSKVEIEKVEILIQAGEFNCVEG